MAKKFKKEVLTLEEIGSIIYEKAEGRYKNLNSAYSAAKKAALKLGIEDINGKKRNKLIAARDAEAIVDLVLEPKNKEALPEVKPEQKPLQVSIFDLGLEIEGADASIGFDPVPVVPVITSEEETKQALKRFLDARRDLEALIGCKIIIYFKDSFI